MQKITQFRYKELDQPHKSAEEEERPNTKYFKQRVMGKIVKVSLVDGREYVGRLQCVDDKLNVFIQTSAMVIKKQDNPMYYEHDHFSCLQNQLPESSEEFEFAGSIIVGADKIKKMEVDYTLSRKVEEEVKRQKELWIEREKERTDYN